MESNYSYVNFYLKQSEEDFGCPICFDNLSKDHFSGEVSEITQKVHKTACGKLLHTSCAEECWQKVSKCPACNVATLSFDQEREMWANELFAQRIQAEEEKVSNERKAASDADEALARKLQADFNKEAEESTLPTELGSDISKLQEGEKVSKKRKAGYDAGEEFARKLQADFDKEAQQAAPIEPEKKKLRHEESTLQKVSETIVEKMLSQGASKPIQQEKEEISRQDLVEILKKYQGSLKRFDTFYDGRSCSCLIDLLLIYNDSYSLSSSDIFIIQEILKTCVLDGIITGERFRQASAYVSMIEQRGGRLN